MFLEEDGIKINLPMWVGLAQALEASVEQRVSFSEEEGILPADDLWT